MNRIGIKIHQHEDGDQDEDDEDEEKIDEHDSEEGDELDEFLDRDDDDGDDDDDDEDYGSARLRRLEAQERIIREKLQKLAPENEDDGDDEDSEQEEAEEGEEGWGKSRRAYYGVDTSEYELMDGEDDAQLLEEEEEEARRMQKEAAKRLRPEDFGLDDDEDEEEDEEEEERRGKNMKKRSKTMQEDEQKEREDEDEEELNSLIKEMTTFLEEVKEHVAPLLAQCSAAAEAARKRKDQKNKRKNMSSKKTSGGGDVHAMDAGVSYLEAKYLLMMSYCSHIAFFLLLRAEGRSVRDHPVMTRLMEIRAAMERARPIDKRMRTHIASILEADKEGAKDHALRPRPDMLVANDSARANGNGKHVSSDDDDHNMDAEEHDEQEEERDTGLYRPPRTMAMAMDGDGDDYKKERAAAAAARASRGRISGSEYLRSLASELGGIPEEMANIGGAASLRLSSAGREMRDARKILRARQAAEEEAFVRLPASATERKKIRAAERARGIGATMADFAHDMDAVAEEIRGNGDGAQGRRRAMRDTTRASGMDARTKGDAFVSGDAEPAPRESLAERRMRFGSRRAILAAAMANGNFEDDSPPESDHPEYARAVAAADAKKSARAARNTTSGQTTFAPVRAADVDDDSKRKVNSAIAKNRGLTPHRKKISKNPRKKHRMAYEKALVRRKGQVQSVRDGEAGGYAGEKSGVRTGIVKSRKL